MRMNKKIIGLAFVVLLGLFLLGGCGQMKDLKDTLTDGDGKWELVTEHATYKIAFFKNETINQRGSSSDHEVHSNITIIAVS